MIINGLGAICTAIVVIVFSVTKFFEGAWIVLILIPLMVITLQGIHRHYQRLAREPVAGKLRRAPAGSTSPHHSAR